MITKHYKQMLRLGKAFVIYDTCKTSVARVYKYNGQIYCNPRGKASRGQIINGVKNLIPCTPAEFGLLIGYTEITK